MLKFWSKLAVELNEFFPFFKGLNFLPYVALLKLTVDLVKLQSTIFALVYIFFLSYHACAKIDVPSTVVNTEILIFAFWRENWQCSTNPCHSTLN